MASLWEEGLEGRFKDLARIKEMGAQSRQSYIETLLNPAKETADSGKPTFSGLERWSEKKINRQPREIIGKNGEKILIQYLSTASGGYVMTENINGVLLLKSVVLFNPSGL